MRTNDLNFLDYQELYSTSVTTGNAQNYGESLNTQILKTPILPLVIKFQNEVRFAALCMRNIVSSHRNLIVEANFQWQVCGAPSENYSLHPMVMTSATSSRRLSCKLA